MNQMFKFIFFTSTILLFACSETPLPKPTSYYRIDLKERTFSYWENSCPFKFKVSNQATMKPSKTNNKDCYWDLSYPAYNATIYLSYLPVNNDLKALIDQEYSLREKHNVFSTGVNERIFQNELKKVSAMIFNVKGTKAATPLQFFITDSVNHFFRGTLYFYNSPNNDSLAPVIQYIQQDIDSLVESFEWK